MALKDGCAEGNSAVNDIAGADEHQQSASDGYAGRLGQPLPLKLG